MRSVQGSSRLGNLKARSPRAITRLLRTAGSTNLANTIRVALHDMGPLQYLASRCTDANRCSLLLSLSFLALHYTFAARATVRKTRQWMQRGLSYAMDIGSEGSGPHTDKSLRGEEGGLSVGAGLGQVQRVPSFSMHCHQQQAMYTLSSTQQIQLSAAQGGPTPHYTTAQV